MPRVPRGFLGGRRFLMGEVSLFPNLLSGEYAHTSYRRALGPAYASDPPPSGSGSGFRARACRPICPPGVQRSCLSTWSNPSFFLKTTPQPTAFVFKTTPQLLKPRRNLKKMRPQENFEATSKRSLETLYTSGNVPQVTSCGYTYI